MIRWALAGLMRDRTRSFFPFLIVAVGVALTISMMGFMDGVGMSMLDMTAKLDTGHLRLVNKPYYDEEHLAPIDRSLAAEEETRAWLKTHADPRIHWSPRIRWTALMDVPDEDGETRSQTPVAGFALDLLSAGSVEAERLDLQKSLEAGRLPEKPKELVVGYLLAETLALKVNDTVTLLGQSFDGGMAADNYQVVGFIRFGVTAMDKKTAFMDLSGAQHTFYMDEMVTDWLGYLPKSVSYKDYEGIKNEIENALVTWRQSPPPAWASDDLPIILTILDQRNLGPMISKFELIRGVVVVVFTVLMVLVLWNAGLINGIHRHGEMGLRLALGETHKELVGRLVVESLAIGIAGSLAGSLLGGFVVYLLQEVGVNMGDAMAQSGMMMSDVARGRLSVEGFAWGIVPGVAASVCGTFIASLSVFKRSEASLFREMEVG